ncbi:MAG: NAD(P)-dependent oxidoreductase [Alphaproteobacteria bacterium]|jgi:putative dehydrogenase
MASLSFAPGAKVSRIRIKPARQVAQPANEQRGETAMSLTVGVIGLGNIGGGVAANLRQAGYAVLGYDTDAARIAAAGAEPAVDAAAIAAACDLAILAVATFDAYAASIEALAENARDGLVVVDLCTFPIADKHAALDRLAGAGAAYLDGPVSGARPQAQAGELAMMVSGDAAAYTRVEPALAAFTRAVSHVGDFPMSQKLKLALNLMISIQNLLCAEGFLFAEKAGVDLALFADMVKQSAANSRIFEIRADKWISGDYGDPTAELAIQLKDRKIIDDYAAAIGCPTPMFDAAVAFYDRAAERGWHRKDAACVLAVLEEMAGIGRTRNK